MSRTITEHLARMYQQHGVGEEDREGGQPGQRGPDECMATALPPTTGVGLDETAIHGQVNGHT